MSMMIEYLENQDFTHDGRLKQEVHRGLPVFVMFQANGCGWCTKAKPAFSDLINMYRRNDKKVKFMTILANGDKPSEKALATRIRTIYPGITGYPAFMLFLPDGRKYPYDMQASRDAKSFHEFIKDKTR